MAGSRKGLVLHSPAPPRLVATAAENRFSHAIVWFAQLLCCRPRETEHVQVIHPRSLKTRGLGRAAVSQPQSGQSTASYKHHLR